MWEFGWVEYVHGPYEIGRILLEIAVYYVNRGLMCSVVEMWSILTTTTRIGRESMCFLRETKVRFATMRSNWPATEGHPNLNVKNGGVFDGPAVGSGFPRPRE